jgi:hypothetical protein
MPTWIPSTKIIEFQNSKNCHECKSPFNIFNGRHHCRYCGKSVCGDCHTWSPLPELGYTDSVITCFSCIDEKRIAYIEKWLNLDTIEGIDIAFELAACDISDKLLCKGQELFEKARFEPHLYEVALKCFVYSKVTFLFWEVILHQLVERGETRWHDNYLVIIRKQMGVAFKYKYFFDKIESTSIPISQKVHQVSTPKLFSDIFSVINQNVLTTTTTHSKVLENLREEIVHPYKKKVRERLRGLAYRQNIHEIKESSFVPSYDRNIDELAGEPPPDAFHDKNINDPVGEPPPGTFYNSTIDKTVKSPISSYALTIDLKEPLVSSHKLNIEDTVGEPLPISPQAPTTDKTVGEPLPISSYKQIINRRHKV